jgi:hypothetical protein
MLTGAEGVISFGVSLKSVVLPLLDLDKSAKLLLGELSRSLDVDPPAVLVKEEMKEKIQHTMVSATKIRQKLGTARIFPFDWIHPTPKSHFMAAVSGIAAVQWRLCDRFVNFPRAAVLASRAGQIQLRCVAEVRSRFKFCFCIDAHVLRLHVTLPCLESALMFVESYIFEHFAR